MSIIDAGVEPCDGVMFTLLFGLKRSCFTASCKILRRVSYEWRDQGLTVFTLYTVH